jgi:hypothetical protein
MNEYKKKYEYDGPELTDCQKCNKRIQATLLRCPFCEERQYDRTYIPASKLLELPTDV